MSLENQWAGMSPAKVDSEAAASDSKYDGAVMHVLEFLDKHNARDVAELLKGLPENAKKILYGELGGDLGCFYGGSRDIKQTEEALTEYVSNIPTYEESYSGKPDILNPKKEIRKNAVEKLKRSIDSD